MAVDAVREHLLTDRLKSCANPQCTTFGRFAQSLLDASGTLWRPLTELTKRHLLRRLITHGVESGQITYFRPIADTPGFLQLVSRTIQEWKRLEIWPEELAAAYKRSGHSQKGQELYWLYAAYQRLLNEHHLYDSEGKLWSARALLRESKRPFENLRWVFVDGFTDFTRTQSEMLTILAERVEQLTLTLPRDIDSPHPSPLPKEEGVQQARGDLFAKPIRTLDNLKRCLPGLSIETMDRRATSWLAMDHLEYNLFRAPFDIRPINDVAGLEIVSSAGQLNEIEGIARRIKQFLTNGCDGQTISPGEILVVYRSLGEIAPLVREVFDRFGIPSIVESARALGEAACISALLTWLRLAAEDWPFRQLLTALSHNSLHPEWLEWQHGRAILALDQLVREFQIPVGRKELLRRIARLTESASEHPETTKSPTSQRRTQRALLAAPLLAKLSKALQALPQSATGAEWSVALNALANEIGLSKLIRGSKSEESAWMALATALHSFDRLAAWQNQPAEKFSLPDLVDRVVEIAECETIPRPFDDIGRVRVVSATIARSLTAPYVFLAGLSEKAFPAADREDALYGDAETTRLVEAGLPLTTRQERNQTEMLLFYEVATRATRRLIMSYPGLDAKAQPLSASPYVVELKRAFAEGCLKEDIDLQLSPVPRGRNILCERDLRIRAVADAMEKNRRLLAGMVQTGKSAATSNILAALTTIHARGQRDFGLFEGVFDHDTARAKLAERFGPDRCWSASQLERYAYCPFQFFAQRVLQIEPLADLSLEVNHQFRGKLLHGTLSQVHRQIVDEGGQLVSPAMQRPEEFERAAKDVLAMLLENIASDDPMIKSLQEVDRRLLQEWLSNYYLQHQEYDKAWSEFESPLRPAHFEVSFGPLSDAADGEPEEVPVDCDELTTTKPLEISHRDEKVRLRGRIDRIDVGQINGRTVFNVIDYKSASEVKFSGETITDGRTLQLPLYALAVEQLLLIDRQALPWRASYWLVKEKGFRHRSALAFYQLVDGEFALDPVWENLRDQLLSRVVSLVRGIRAGQFPMHCADENCTGRCPYHTVCRVGQARSLDKTWQPPEAAP